MLRGTPPREYAAEMLKAFREWEKDWLERVPQELRAMVAEHVNGEIAKAYSRSKQCAKQQGKQHT
jgi:hypothetical protein